MPHRPTTEVQDALAEAATRKHIEARIERTSPKLRQGMIDFLERRTPNGWKAIPSDVTSSTVVLRNPGLLWPQRSIERRIVFQSLLKRYTRQLLYGCSEPSCQTPTCLSCQKRTAKGPFRPYTVLSARALATFLASQDHPEKGLCPHLSAKQAPDLVPAPQRAGVLSGDRAQQSLRNYEQSDAPKPIFGAGNDADQRILETYNREDGPQVSQVAKAKDHKSFAQNLFDTTSMKRLDLEDLSSGIRSEPRPSAAGQKSGIKTAATEEPGYTKPAQQPEASLPSITRGHTDAANSEEQKSPSNMRSTPVASATQVALDERLAPSSGRMGFLQRESRKWQLDMAATEFPNPAQSLSHFSRDNLQVLCNHALSSDNRSDEVQDLLRYFGRSDMNHLANPDHRGGEAHARYIAFIRQSTSYVCSTSRALLRSFVVWKKHQDRTTKIRSLCLWEIIDALSWIQWLDDPYIMFSSLWISAGKIYTPGPSSMVSRANCQDNQASNSPEDHAPWPPQPSESNGDEESSAAGLRPGGAKRHNLDDNLAGIESPSASGSDRQLNDGEAAHLVKITFAALLAFVPDIATTDPPMLFAIQTLRHMGRVAAPKLMPPGYAGSPKLMPLAIDRVQQVLDCFEDEQAISLIVRLTKAMVSRQYMGKWNELHQSASAVDMEHEHTHKSFMTLVVQNLVDADGLQVLLPEERTNNRHQPSLEGGVPINTSKNRIMIGQAVGVAGHRLIVEWVLTVILKKWDGKPEVPRCGAVGGAFEFLRHMYIHCSASDCPPSTFYLPFILERLDVVNMPVHWANHPTDPSMVHLLSYPFLFPPSALVAYFRAINHNAMSKAYEEGLVNTELPRRLNYSDHELPSSRGEIRLLDRLRAPANKYLVLDIRRNSILEDAMDQLWRREPFELMKPLKVRLGMEEGEEGVDHGGVQQEFFRLAIAEALDPKYGAFTTDPTTRMSWFQPLSLEPNYKFELIGLLTSLAIYNGLTLPFTFPKAFYRKLDGIPVETIEDIRDGWSELAKGLQSLLDWDDGDVEEVFMRSYTFSLDVFGTTIDVDMDAHRRRKARKSTPTDAGYGNTIDSNSDTSSTSSGELAFHVVSSSKGEIVIAPNVPDSESPSDSKPGTPLPQANPTTTIPTITTSPPIDEVTNEETSNEPKIPHPWNRRPDSPTTSTPMVTNANRHQYVRDYITHLTSTSIAPQFAAFAYGFRRCLRPKSCLLFNEDTIKLLIEGYTSIDTHALQSVTRYEGGFHPKHKTIRQFWNVVHEWGDSKTGGEEGQGKVRNLLEFVTASDRLPVGGVERVTFVVQRNGVGDERLPTSLTCFGRLLLPEFTDREALRKGLGRAIEEARGFGVP